MAKRIDASLDEFFNRLKRKFLYLWRKTLVLIEWKWYTNNSNLDKCVLLQNREVTTVEVSYKKLWKILIDKDMKKKDLQAVAGISWASVTKLSKGETVSMDVLMKVCKALNCNIGDVVDLIPEDENRE